MLPVWMCPGFSPLLLQDSKNLLVHLKKRSVLRIYQHIETHATLLLVTVMLTQLISNLKTAICKNRYYILTTEANFVLA